MIDGWSASACRAVEGIDERDHKESVSIERAVSTLESDASAFSIERSEFSQQYSSLYFVRLNVIRTMIMERIKREADASVKLCATLLEVQSDRDCIVIGTVYKNMKLKPCVLDEYETEEVVRETRCNESALTGCFVSDDDSLELEDEHARLILTGDPSVLGVAGMVTGVVVGVRGRIQPSGKFLISEVYAAGLSNQPAFPLTSDDKFVMIVSGLEVGPHCAPLNSLLIDHVTGFVGSTHDRQLMSMISRVIVCGNSIAPRTSATDSNASLKSKLAATQDSEMIRSLRAFDQLLEQLCSSCDVTVMPGDHDPSNMALPQQPIHHLLLPRSSLLSTLSRTTNPAHMTIDGVLMTGTSGQNVSNIADYVDGLGAMDILEKTLQWRITAPTCPDTLPSFPFNDRDPFVLVQTPHIYFAGNQDKFETKVTDVGEGRVRLICVPSFAKTGQVVLVNLRNLDCDMIQYSQSSSSSDDADRMQ